MKAKILLLFLLLTAPLAGATHTVMDLKTATTAISNHVPEFHKEVEQLQNGLKITFTLDSAALIDDHIVKGAKYILYGSMPLLSGDGIPQIPFNMDNVMVPDLEKCTVEVLEDDYIEVPIVLSPARRPALIGDKNPEENIAPIKLSDKFYPELPAVKNQTYQYRDTKLLQLCVNPVQYNSRQKIARIHRKLSVLVSYGDNETAPSISAAAAKDPILSNTMTAEKKEGPQKSIQLTVSEPADESYLIISNKRFQTAISKFKNWKKRTGRKVITKFQDKWTVDQVKQCIADFYSTDSNAKYLLIVGDTVCVPAAIHYYTRTDKSGERIYAYSDLPYACVSGADEYPDLFYGRIPSRTVNGVTSALNKIVSYEKNPKGDFYRSVFSAASCFYGDFNTGEESSSSLVRSVETICQAVEANFDGVDRFYTAEKIDSIQLIPKSWYRSTYPEFAFPDFLNDTCRWLHTGKDVLDGINRATNIIVHNGHASSWGWNLPDFNTNYTGSLTNTTFPVMFSLNCESGKYMGPGNFVRQLIERENSGCASVIAATDETYIRTNEHFLLGMMNSLFYGKRIPCYANKKVTYYFGNTPDNDNWGTPPLSLGEIMNLGFQATASYLGPTNSTVQSDRKAYHCFGDPSLNVYWNKNIDLSNLCYSYYSNGYIYAHITRIINEDTGLPINGYISFSVPPGNTVKRFYGNYACIKSDHPESTFVHFSVPGAMQYVEMPTINENKDERTTTPYIETVSFLSGENMRIIIGGDLQPDLQVAVTTSDNLQTISSETLPINEKIIQYNTTNQSGRFFFITLKRGSEVLDTKRIYKK